MINAMHLEAATNYPLLNVFWTMLFFFAWMVWAFLFIYIAFDIFSSHDLNGLMKVLWLLLLLIPFIGAAIYLIVRGKGMGGSHTVVGRGHHHHGKPVGEQLSQLTAQRDAGTITPAEFEAKKTKLLYG